MTALGIILVSQSAAFSVMAWWWAHSAARDAAKCLARLDSILAALPKRRGPRKPKVVQS